MARCSAWAAACAGLGLGPACRGACRPACRASGKPLLGLVVVGLAGLEPAGGRAWPPRESRRASCLACSARFFSRSASRAAPCRSWSAVASALLGHLEQSGVLLQLGLVLVHLLGQQLDVGAHAVLLSSAPTLAGTSPGRLTPAGRPLRLRTMAVAALGSRPRRACRAGLGPNPGSAGTGAAVPRRQPEQRSDQHVERPRHRVEADPHEVVGDPDLRAGPRAGPGAQHRLGHPLG